MPASASGPRSHAGRRLGALARKVGEICGLAFSIAFAAPCQGSSEVDASDRAIEEIVVTADLGSMPGSDVSTVFGFDKSILETPRSASTVTDEMMSRFIVSDIDELIALAPGSFTQSFFGVAGTLDIRGTTGETYFRGIRRLDNPGNYPTPIAASSRVDIVRGPHRPFTGRPRSAATSTSTRSRRAWMRTAIPSVARPASKRAPGQGGSEPPRSAARGASEPGNSVITCMPRSRTRTATIGA